MLIRACLSMKTSLVRLLRTAELFAGGVRAIGPDSQDLGSHQAFWFAWSQFYPDTALWEASQELEQKENI